MSARTLRRRLEEEGTTMQALLDDLRQELASRYLGERKLTQTEVALELGFADARAFRRAFKRWTGKTPGDRG
jgi:AraC-like DNA-binding protein